MAEQFCRVGEIELCYESFGDPADPTMLLIMGLGTQMVAWREELCEQLAGHGFRVVRFDNRDIGRSSRIDAAPPRLRHLLLRSRRAGAYTIDDMADDAAGLLDCLDVERAHVVGASMGGMIAQTLAIEHPERVRSLVSMMSTTGSRWVGLPAFKALGVLLGPAPRNREAAIERALKTFGVIGSPGYPFDPERLRHFAGLAYDRGHSSAGVARQLHAIVASGDRTAGLRGVRAPTTVIHGDGDVLVRPSGGRATARAVAGARLKLIEGMGHDLPPELWETFVTEIAGTAARAPRAHPTLA